MCVCVCMRHSCWFLSYVLHPPLTQLFTSFYPRKMNKLIRHTTQQSSVPSSQHDHEVNTTQQSSVSSFQHDREVTATQQSSVPSSQHEVNIMSPHLNIHILPHTYISVACLLFWCMQEVADHELKEEELPSTVVSPTAAGAGEPSSESYSTHTHVH